MALQDWLASGAVASVTRTQNPVPDTRKEETTRVGVQGLRSNRYGHGEAQGLPSLKQFSPGAVQGCSTVSKAGQLGHDSRLTISEVGQLGHDSGSPITGSRPAISEVGQLQRSSGSVILEASQFGQTFGP